MIKRICSIFLLSFVISLLYNITAFANARDELWELIDRYDDPPKYLITAVEGKEFQTKRLIVKTWDNTLLEGIGEEKTLQISENGVFVMQFNTIEDTKATYNYLKALPWIESIVPDIYISASDDLSNFQLAYNGSPRSSPAVEQIKFGEYAYKLIIENKPITKDNRIKVAIIDTWIDITHPYLKDNIIIPADYRHTPDEIYYHGTHIAGIIANVAAPYVDIIPLPLRTISGSDSMSTTSELLMLIDMAVHDYGVDIVNMSIAYKGISKEREYDPLELVIKDAISNGALIIAAAGNGDWYGNDPVNTSNVLPAAFGIHNGFITVGAVDGYNKIRANSNFGDAVDISAPGENIISSIPSDRIAIASGTSMATAYVSAAAALLKVEYPYLTPEQLENQIKELAVKIEDDEKKYGAGILSLELLALQMPEPEYSSDEDIMTPVMIVVNGRELPPQMPICVNINGVPYVYFEALAEALDANMDASVWETTTKRMTLSVGDTLLTMQIGSPIISITAVKNGRIAYTENYDMLVEPIILDDYALVPVEYVINALGGVYSWSPSAYRVDISYNLPAPTIAPMPTVELVEPVAVISPVPTNAAESYAQPKKGHDVKVYLNNKEIIYDVRAMEIDRRPMIPLSQTFKEITGKGTAYDPLTRTSTWISNGHTNVHISGTNYVSIDGVPIYYDTSSIILNDRVIVPINMIIDTSGLMVTWDALHYSVYITKPSSAAELQNEPFIEQMFPSLTEYSNYYQSNSFSAYNGTANNIRIPIGMNYLVIDDLIYDISASAYISPQGATMVPIYYIARALGCSHNDIIWSDNYTTLIIIHPTGVIRFTNGSDHYIFNNTSFSMDYTYIGAGIYTTEIRDEMMFVPLRAVGEAFGLSVGWDSVLQSAILHQ